MAPFAVSITKSLAWRGGTEEFSNVYHYDYAGTALPPSDAGWLDLINQIVAIEKPLHATVVTFVRARVWGPTNAGPDASITRYIADLSGTGTGAFTGHMWRELTVVGQFFMGRSPSTQRKTYLRKYYHVGALASSAAGSNPVLGTAPLAAGDKTPVTTALNALKTITVGGVPNDLCKPGGAHLPVGSSPQILDYAHIRQFRQ